MNKKTVLQFCGKLAREFPEMFFESVRCAQGDKLEIVNNSVKIIDALSRICDSQIEKNNSKLLRSSFDKLKEEDNKMNEALLLKTENSLLQEKKKIIEEYKKKLQENHDKYKNELLEEMLGKISIKQSEDELKLEVEDKIRNILNEALDIQADFISNNRLSYKNQNKAIEYFRLLQKEYIKFCKAI